MINFAKTINIPIMLKLPGTPLIYIIGFCISIFLIGCTSKSFHDLQEIESFYDGVDTKDFLNQKQEDLTHLDSVYYFKYTKPIEGFTPAECFPDVRFD